ncbi:hypothetical protein Bca101_019753 [Brassica carinata]
MIFKLPHLIYVRRALEASQSFMAGFDQFAHLVLDILRSFGFGPITSDLFM